MRRVVSLFILSFIFSCVGLNGQREINSSAKKYYNIATKILIKPNPSNKEAQKAVTNLNLAFQEDPEYPLLKFYSGLGYLHLENYDEAWKWLGSYKDATREYHKDFDLYYGFAAYKQNENIIAQEHLQVYINSYSGGPYKDSLALRIFQLSRQSQTLMSKVLPSKKEFLTAINTDEGDEFYPVLTPDKKHIFFNRLSWDNEQGKKVNKIYDYNLELPPGENNPSLLPINNLQGKEFIITSVSSNGRKILLISKDKRGKYDVYESEYMVREWRAPHKMYSQINSTEDEKFATYGHNDSLIYIVSNRPGGYGGYDIWKINYNDRYIHESLINLGPQINTEYDENYISCVNNSNIVFFTSEGHLCIGESDIFKTKLEYGQYSRPVNLGYPINTNGNEETFFAYPTANMGLTVINNEIGDLGAKSSDIYITYLPPKAKKPGYIFDQDYINDIKLRNGILIIPQDE